MADNAGDQNVIQNMGRINPFIKNPFTRFYMCRACRDVPLVSLENRQFIDKELGAIICKDVNQMLFWDGFQVVFADTLEPFPLLIPTPGRPSTK
ncbi:hypothetical protein CCACVL1_18166 [Corchorus capsularis]|uniref:Uncharacterized protein n=1 Tax=Corchorus capsularis TaxID=210143 RepID=A0A1R3HMD8_COCAP|nr:hypothetical protein CCACVL1_18166 [Corchorus capsularis]